MNKEKREQIFPFSDLKENANTLIFPNLESGNIAYKLMQEFDDVEAIGPILIGMKKPVHILQLGCSVREIVNMVTIAVIDAQTKKMITHIQGKLVGENPSFVIIDCNGIGYFLRISLQTFSKLSNDEHCMLFYSFVH